MAATASARSGCFRQLLNSLITLKVFPEPDGEPVAGDNAGVGRSGLGSAAAMNDVWVWGGEREERVSGLFGFYDQGCKIIFGFYGGLRGFLWMDKVCLGWVSVGFAVGGRWQRRSLPSAWV
uniref:Uncharacterized protein n=1 Tax=Fagus sylvatica TaxID=28930 RepID=A0A2N9EPD2_FAGSY